jgi:6-phosphogluconolactonase
MAAHLVTTCFRACFLATLVACAQQSASPRGLVVFGGRSDVAVFGFDAQTGALVERTRVAMPGRSAYMAVSPDHRFVYAGHGEQPGHVTAFALGPSGGLVRLNDQSTALGEDAMGISHLAVHPDGRWLLGAWGRPASRASSRWGRTRW